MLDLNTPPWKICREARELLLMAERLDVLAAINDREGRPVPAGMLRADAEALREIAQVVV